MTNCTCFRVANSVTIEEDGTLRIDFALKGIETAQIFSIRLANIAWIKEDTQQRGQHFLAYPW